MNPKRITSSTSTIPRHATYAASGQLDLFLDSVIPIGESPALWTPRDIWVRANQRVLEYLKEDRRFERKATRQIHVEEFARYCSAFSNTPDGGMIVYGIENNGNIVGCSNLSTDQLNRIESCHLTLCPASRPEFKKVSVIVDGREEFCLSIYIPYVGKLVETNKGEAWIRYGETIHKMSEEEKRDFRATRQETTFELDVANYSYPSDFDLHIIQDFCDAYRNREGQNLGAMKKF